MDINKKIIEARFIRRPNRFQAYVEIEGIETMVHVPNTGRCKEILLPDSKVLLRYENNPLRKTQYDLIAAYKNNKLINIDSQIPNKVVDEALKLGKINELRKYEIIRREKTFGNSRFDFKLESYCGEEYYLEVKGVTFEMNGCTMFPDAPTERGTKHLLELIEVKKRGMGAGVFFLIQMDSAEYFTPYDNMDKAFGNALRLAYRSGVDIFAYDCTVSKNSISINSRIEVRL